MMVEDRKSLGLPALEEGAEELIRAARGQTGLVGIATTFNARSPQLYLDIDRTKVESLGIPMNNVFNTLQAYLGSAYVNLFNKFNQSYQVYVQAAAPYRISPENIKDLYVRNDKEEMVPLGTLMSIKRTLGASFSPATTFIPRCPCSALRRRASAPARP